MICAAVTVVMLLFTICSRMSDSPLSDVIVTLSPLFCNITELFAICLQFFLFFFIMALMAMLNNVREREEMMNETWKCDCSGEQGEIMLELLCLRCSRKVF